MCVLRFTDRCGEKGMNRYASEFGMFDQRTFFEDREGREESQFQKDFNGSHAAMPHSTIS